jgi:hypothetical protein
MQLHTLRWYVSIAACVAVFSPCVGSPVYDAVKVGSLDTQHTALPCPAGALR